MAGGFTQEGKTQRLQLSFFRIPHLSLAQKNAGFPEKWTSLEKVTQEREKRLRTRKKRIDIPQADGWDMATAEINPRKSQNCGGSCVVASNTQKGKEDRTTRNSGIPPNSAHFRKNREIARFCRNVWYYLRKSRIPEFRRIPFQCCFSPMPRQRFFANLLFFPPAPRCVPLRFSVTGRVIIKLRIPSLKHGSHKILEIPNSGIPV